MLHQRARSDVVLGLGIEGVRKNSKTPLIHGDRPFFGKRRHSLVPSYVYPLFRGKTIFLLASLALFLLATELTLKDYVYIYPLFQSADALAATESSLLHSRAICPTCNSSEVGSFAKSSTAHPMPSLERLQSGKATEAEMARYIATNIYMRGQEDPTPMDDVARFKMLSTFLTNPDLLFSYSFEGIKMRRPTSYIFTRVGGGDRLGTSELRLKYLQRHADTIDEYHELVEREGFSYGVGIDDRQLLWIIVEDDAQIDQNTAHWLASTGLPYIYFSWGRTNTIGLSQWRIVLRTIEFLRDDLLADGPVYSLDADNYIKPELLRKIWQVKKAIFFQIGGFRTHDPPGIDSDWEGPFVEKGNLKRWHVGWNPSRTFPIDMGAFAINSSVLGKEVRAPYYVPLKEWVGDDTTNESEFLSQIYKTRSEAEFLCHDTREEKCYFAWHNHWMPEEVARGFPAPVRPDFE